jgi:hypothetical protein
MAYGAEIRDIQTLRQQRGLKTYIQRYDPVGYCTVVME